MHCTFNPKNGLVESSPMRVAVETSRYPKLSTPDQTSIKNNYAEKRSKMTIDINRFRSRWEALTSDEEFENLLSQYGISRIQAFELVGDAWAAQVPIEALLSRLELLVKLGLNCTITTANAIATFTYVGKVESILERSGQFILVTRSTRLQFTKSKINSAWVVKKPNNNSIITSLELFNSTGSAVVKIVGCCDQEKDEMDIWDDLTQTIPRMDEVIDGERASGFANSNH